MTTSTPSLNREAFAAAGVALVAHKNQLGIEGDASAQLWHLLLSLHEYCGATGLPLDTLIMDVRAAVAAGEVSSPAWNAYANQSETRVKLPLQLLREVQRDLIGSSSPLKKDIDALLETIAKA